MTTLPSMLVLLATCNCTPPPSPTPLPPETFGGISATAVRDVPAFKPVDGYGQSVAFTVKVVQDTAGPQSDIAKGLSGVRSVAALGRVLSSNSRWLRFDDGVDPAGAYRRAFVLANAGKLVVVTWLREQPRIDPRDDGRAAIVVPSNSPYHSASYNGDVPLVAYAGLPNFTNRVCLTADGLFTDQFSPLSCAFPQPRSGQLQFFYVP
jgi:hypothetical protein